MIVNTKKKCVEHIISKWNWTVLKENLACHLHLNQQAFHWMTRNWYVELIESNWFISPWHWKRVPHNHRFRCYPWLCWHHRKWFEKNRQSSVSHHGRWFEKNRQSYVSNTYLEAVIRRFSQLGLKARTAEEGSERIRRLLCKLAYKIYAENKSGKGLDC